MRLLNLPQKALDALSANQISMGHARALLGSSSPKQMLDIVLKGELSVRETESHIRQAEAEIRGGTSTGGGAKSPAKSTPSAGHKDADTRALERDLSAILGLDVAIEHTKKGAGEISVKYMTLDQLDDLCRRLMGASA